MLAHFEWEASQVRNREPGKFEGSAFLRCCVCSGEETAQGPRLLSDEREFTH